jgi:hypothetical protein
MPLREDIADEIAAGRLPRHWTTGDLLDNRFLAENYAEAGLRTAPPNYSVALPATGLQDGHHANPQAAIYYRVGQRGHVILYALPEDVPNDPIKVLAPNPQGLPVPNANSNPRSNSEARDQDPPNEKTRRFHDIPVEEERVILNRDSFLADPDVAEFTDFLAGYLGIGNGQLAHSYLHRKEGYEWQCNSLFDAAARYRYPIAPEMRHYCGGTAPNHFYRTLVDNAAVLDAIETKIKVGLHKSDNTIVSDAANEILIWGGTDRGGHNSAAIADLNATPGQFLGYIGACDASFGNGLSVDLSKLRASGYGLRSNAGFTKIYSMCFKDFVIYDSRVAAALGMLITRFWLRKSPVGSKTVSLQIPSSLSLVWLAGTPGSIRDPNKNGAGIYGFPSHTHVDHLLSNIKANWILAKAASGSHFESMVKDRPHQFPVTALRALEAAMFMLGYDLHGNWPY